MSLNESINVIIEEEHFVLLAEKALFWEDEKGLIISDVHLGKAGHFRRNGIALPQSSNDKNLEIINGLINSQDPKWILFLGDLFHSEKNEEWKTFKTWRASHPEIEMFLVIGNHEILSLDEYEDLGVRCMSEFQAGPFLFLHDYADAKKNESLYVISGHIHPAIRLKGKGRQTYKIPCFYFEERSAILPAFGTLTGTYKLKPQKSASIYGILEQQIFKIQ